MVQLAQMISGYIFLLAKSMNERANNCKREQTRQQIELYFALTTV